MASIVAFHVVMLLLALGIVTRVVPTKVVANLIGYLHNSIGITTPAPEQMRTIALVWIGSTVIIGDGCLFLTVLIVSMSHPGR